MKIFYSFILFFFLFIGRCFSQDSGSVFYLDSLPVQGVLLDKSWRFHSGDNPEWASPEFNDSQWENINPLLELPHLPQIKKTPVGWFRIKLRVDSSLLNKPLAFQVYQSLASEIYLNGELIKRYGTVSPNSREVKAFQPVNEPVGLVFKEQKQILAVRFSVQQNIPYLRTLFPYTAFGLRINDVEGAERFESPLSPVMNAVHTGIFLILTVIHLGLFLVFRKQKANLYFSIATLSVGIANGLIINIMYAHDIEYRAYALMVDWVCLLTLFNLFLFIAIHQLFSGKRKIYFWTIVGYSLASIAFWWVFYNSGEFLAFMLPFAVGMLAALRIAWQGYRRGQRDAGIIVVGTAIYLISYFIFTLIYQGYISDVDIGISNFTLVDVAYHTAILCVPMTLSFYLVRDFAFTSRELENKLLEVQQLSAEKEEILAFQKEELEQQVTQRTAELKKSLEELKEEADKGNITEVKAIANDVIDNEEKINHHGKRADAIVKGMLQHSRQAKGVMEPTDINALCDEYLRLSYHGLRAKDKDFNADFKTDFDISIGKINIVPQDVGRVLLNLYNNAFYAVNEKHKNLSGLQDLTGLNNHKPLVSVQTKRINDKIEIIISDNGNGIPKNIIDKIFQPFFTTKPTGEGTGLGLSLSYDIIKAHGGEIKVETNEGEGTIFKIILHLI